MTVENKALPAIPAKRYFTIGEVSELCGVKAYVLRYWEQEFTQLKPMKRRGNRRYYQHHEVLLIRRIRDLLYEQGFTISGARNQLVDAGGGHAHALAQSHSGAHDADKALRGADADEHALRDSNETGADGDPDVDRRGGVRAGARPGGVAADTSNGTPSAVIGAQGAGDTDEAARAARAARDVATIAQARLDLTAPQARAAKSPRLTLGAGPSSGTMTSRTIALQARPPVVSSAAAAPLDEIYTTAQVRDELLAIRSLLVG